MSVSIEVVIFLIFSVIAVGSAAMAVTASDPVRAVLALVLAFFASSGMWMLAQAEFLALILVLVYVGAVMTLFLFMVMMLNIDSATVRGKFWHYSPYIILSVGLMLMMLFISIHPQDFGVTYKAGAVLEAVNSNNTRDLGNLLYTVYGYPFVLAGCLLLVAIIAAIALAHRPPRNCKTQNVVEQIRIKREDRVRLVKMKSYEEPAE